MATKYFLSTNSGSFSINAEIWEMESNLPADGTSIFDSVEAAKAYVISELDSAIVTLQEAKIRVLEIQV